jgi:hypothetical protein
MSRRYVEQFSPPRCARRSDIKAAVPAFDDIKIGSINHALAFETHRFAMLLRMRRIGTSVKPVTIVLAPLKLPPAFPHGEEALAPSRSMRPVTYLILRDASLRDARCWKIRL